MKHVADDMKSIVISIFALILGMLASDFVPLVDFLKLINAEFMLNKYIVIPCLILLILLVIKQLHFIATYTDEYVPFQLSVLSLILTILGLYIFVRIMILGLIILIVSSYWSRKTVQQYYPKKRIIEQ